MVSPSRGLPVNIQQVAPTSNRPICHEVQQEVTSVCVGSRCTQPVMGGSGPVCLLTSSHLGQSGGEIAGLPMQKNHSDCSGWPHMPLFWDLDFACEEVNIVCTQFSFVKTFNMAEGQVKSNRTLPKVVAIFMCYL